MANLVVLAVVNMKLQYFLHLLAAFLFFASAYMLLVVGFVIQLSIWVVERRLEALQGALLARCAGLPGRIRMKLFVFTLAITVTIAAGIAQLALSESAWKYWILPPWQWCAVMLFAIGFLTYQYDIEYVEQLASSENWCQRLLDEDAANYRVTCCRSILERVAPAPMGESPLQCHVAAIDLSRAAVVDESR